MPPTLKTTPEAASRYLAGRNEGGTAFTYHSERSNARATHIRHCPREPRDVHRASGPWSPPANRVRSATASGYVGLNVSAVRLPVNRVDRDATVRALTANLPCRYRTKTAPPTTALRHVAVSLGGHRCGFNCAMSHPKCAILSHLAHLCMPRRFLPAYITP